MHLLLLLLLSHLVCAQVRLDSLYTMSFSTDSGKYAWRRSGTPVPTIYCIGTGCESVPMLYLYGTCKRESLTVDWKCEVGGLPSQLRVNTAKLECEPLVPTDKQYVVGGSCAIAFSVLDAYEPERQK